MDTKLKNIEYRSWIKYVLSLLIIIAGTVFLWSASWVSVNDGAINKSYSNSYQFRVQFSKLVHEVVDLNVAADGNDKLDFISSELVNNKNFKYIIRDVKTGKTVNTNTKMTIEEILSLKNFVYYGRDSIEYSYGNIHTSYELSNYIGYVDSRDSDLNGEKISKLLSSKKYEIYAGINDKLFKGDFFYDAYEKDKALLTAAEIIIPLMYISLCALIILLILITIACGREKYKSELKLLFIDKYAIEIQLLAYIFVFQLMIVAMREGSVTLELVYNIGFFSFVALIMILVIATLIFYCSFVRQIKNKSIIKNSLIGKSVVKLVSIIKNMETAKLTNLIVITFFLTYGLLNMLMGSIYNSRVRNIGFIIINVAFGYLLLKSLNAFSKILIATKDISEGNLDDDLDISKFPKVFVGFYVFIRNIRNGMKDAVNKALKDERMKTELITNLSHDLKTPLTSIISYVDLLKREQLENEKVLEYVDIIEDKSLSLKQLVYGLIEASKVSSGNVDLNIEKINVNELMSQAVGEFENKIKKSNLEIVINQKENINISADGKAMWRIVENLFENIVKYSLEGSRVYINIDELDGEAIVTFKNISAASLDVSPEELIERFVRGSESRTTEGNGLGLSIAEGLVKVQGGAFKIYIDGDLFKVVLKFKLEA